MALANNKGDISKALKELTSSDALKSLATNLFTAAVTAGLDAGMLAELGLGLGLGGSGAGLLGSIVADLPRQVAEATLRAAISTTLEGGRFDKTLLNSLRAVGVNQVLGAVQGVIGDLTDGAGGPDLPVMNMIAHALAGGLAAKAMGGKFEAGAAAALSSAMAANAGLFSGLDPRTLDAVSQLIGGAAALLAGGDAEDVTQGATIARSAAFNNYLTHEEIKELARRLKSCKEKDKKCRLNISLEYLELSKENSKALYSCGIDNVCVLKHIYLINEAYNDLDKYLSDIEIDPWVRKNLIMYQNTDTMHALKAYFYNLHLQKACPSLDTSCVEREKTKDRAKKIGEIILDFTPFIGDIKAFYEAGKSGDPLDWVAAIIGIVPAAGDAAAKELKLLRLAKAGKLKGLSRAEFDKLPEVAHLSKAERDQAFLRFVLGDDVRSWNRFQSSTKGFYTSREEAAKAWEEYKRIHSIKTAAQRNRAAKKFFLRQLAASGKAPKWMNQWLIKGKVPPGYEVDHIKPLSIGGEDSPLNMRLLDIKTHREWHTIYSPWRNPK